MSLEDARFNSQSRFAVNLANFSASFQTDAYISAVHDITLTGNITLTAPVNPTDGQMLTWRFTQDATGSRTLTLVSTAGGFAVPSSITPTLTTTAGKTDQLSARYRLASNKWEVLLFITGF